LASQAVAHKLGLIQYGVNLSLCACLGLPVLLFRRLHELVDAELDWWVLRGQDGVSLHGAQFEDVKLLKRRRETRPVPASV
jgi:hypothetical protein